MRSVMMGLAAVLAAGFAASAAAFDLPRLLPALELPGRSAIRSDEPITTLPIPPADSAAVAGSATAQTLPQSTLGADPSEPSATGQPASPNATAGAPERAPPTRPRGWRDLLPRLLK